jgi:hypothetical protein
LSDRYALNLPKVYAKLVEIMGAEYPVAGIWSEIGKPKNITEAALKKAVRDRAAAGRNRILKPGGLLDFLSHPSVLGLSIASAKSRLADIGIADANQTRVFDKFWPEFSGKYPNWDSPVSQSDRQTLETEIFRRLQAIAKEVGVSKE